MKRSMLSVFICVGMAILGLMTPGRTAVAADVSWTMVVLPDTQNYGRDPIGPPILNQMTQWIVDQKTNRNIEVVVGTGDIVNANLAAFDPDEMWAIGKTALSKFDDEVPYILPTGNHDYNSGRETLYNDYFDLSDNSLNNSPLAGIVTVERTSGELENTYSTFTAPDGRKMLIFSLEWNPRQEMINWANGIAGQAQFQDYTAVLATHGYLKEGDAVAGQPTAVLDGTLGQPLWNGFVNINDNVEMVLSGHFLDGDDVDSNTDPLGDDKLTTAYLADTGFYGNTVHAMVFNAQQRQTDEIFNGGDGYLRLLEFLDDGKTVQVRTYSPVLDVWLTDSHNEFQIELTSVPEPGADLLLVIGLLGTAVRPRKWRR